ncbi:N2227-like protein [Nitzschia inconspicua]|uniref:N2227-like protein n=1 Tax=Nitzschia inconspicua TaxID=303405 RepID=A0A9K3PTL2_9STRA|nr:N2227-like protein [Nitzschia inconspicua]
MQFSEEPPGATRVISGHASGLVIATILVCTIVVLFFSSIGRSIYLFGNGNHPSTDLESMPMIVPFVVLRNTLEGKTGQGRNRYQYPIERLLHTTITDYQNKISQALRGLSHMLEQALTLEATTWIGNKTVAEIGNQESLLSTHIEIRIQRMADALEHNEYLLQQLLEKFQYVMGLPSEPIPKSNKDNSHSSLPFSPSPVKERLTSSTNLFLVDPTTQRNKGNNGAWPLSPLPESESHSYDSAFQIFAHLVRDWTDEGRKIRRSLYAWCCQQVDKHITTNEIQNARILVPGAGMGRLAYQLYQQGHHVEANELSPSMAAAASAILHGKAQGSIYPYVLDVMANEVDSERRYDRTSFPDVPIRANRQGGSLSYTIGDFVGNDGNCFYHDYRREYFDVVVTCFFIDTAHNIYDYVGMINGVLKAKTGIWINVGPVQWHPNAVLRPSVDELKKVLEGLGWQLKVWSIDDSPLSYRDTDGTFVRTTNYEGYRPLRFVAFSTR